MSSWSMPAPDGRVVLCLSGGLDSALCMYRALEAGHELIVHHIVMKNREGRQDVEKRAVDGILRWCRARGLDRFAYTESALDYGSLRFLILDMYIWSLHIGALLADPLNREVRRVIVPRNLDSFRYRPDRSAAAVEQSERRSDERRNAIVRAVAGREPEWLFPMGRMTKADVVADLPPDLRRLCWYCRRPDAGKPCRKCHTCEQVQGARGEVVRP
jgi:7-cyano-7-deazaguanine synthase in queuosine biosynthesis